jgi:hypothetical protein
MMGVHISNLCRGCRLGGNQKRRVDEERSSNLSLILSYSSMAFSYDLQARYWIAAPHHHLNELKNLPEFASRQEQVLPDSNKLISLLNALFIFVIFFLLFLIFLVKI